ncbi:TetR family transcriptional regulator [Kitasatospora herbaricolor]|uniref:TetR/AcrR family transcriptional regulator n=1 Tax=Kitasatospora herbaricolor TaxID=68217 RepID=A0ABZ1W0L6_9ACTN|nr:TetR family transcriptional regulator [Kitasatospora herbaricolor]
MTSIRTVDGRAIGPRGLQTRQLLLEATTAALAEIGYADVQVIDVARAAGTSPATFYQYFRSRDEVVLELAHAAAADFADAIQVPRGDGMVDSNSLAKAVDSFFSIWPTHGPVLRVVELLAPTDKEFSRARNDINKSLTATIARAATGGHAAGLATAMVAMLSATAAQNPSKKAKALARNLVLESTAA